MLTILDKKAKTNATFHYIRSLFAVYQLKDMIQLDIPWWTYPAINALEEYIKGLENPPVVFEYGSGASTLWLAKRSRQVFSIEHDLKWYQQLKNEILNCNNIELLFQPPNGHDFTNYITAITACQQEFDIIVIDGRCRNACLNECLAYLKPQGLIVFDNSDRERYQTALSHPQLILERFSGRVPGSPFRGETALLRKVHIHEQVF